MTHIQCWIPSSNLDLVVLATYLKEYVDSTVIIKPAYNSQNQSQAGYTIEARRTPSVAEVKDIIADSRTWEKEKSGKEFRRNPYSFEESDVWDSRKSKGASAPATTTSSRRRRARSPTSAGSSTVNQAVQRRNDREASPAREAIRSAAAWSAIAQPAISRYQTADKATTQYSLQAAEPNTTTTSNMARYAAPSDKRYDR
jgi:hypothetical protein